MTTSSSFATFAPYTPPPDDPSRGPSSASSSRPSARAWFPNTEDTSYQSGGIPTFNASMAGSGPQVDEDANVNQWETTYGLRVDVLAAVAYLLGPFSALVLLILETQNDYVRFHAYQSALVSTPLVIIWVAASLLSFPSWLHTLLTISLVATTLYMAFRAYRDVTHSNLTRFHIPSLGLLAEQWLSEE
ncbi:hypothetical protein EYR36_007412 [Pleurotus pulmonarius]|nr:hypothetical protein EYR36_007412 [Pleurotus pulmonarius]